MHFLFYSFITFFAGILLSPIPNNYPVPPQNENSLFYIQRSKNTNAIVYELNRLPGGNPDPKNPINIHWLRYASDSTTAPLNYIQNKYAYGVSTRPYKGSNNSFVIELAAYKKRALYLLPAGGKRYAVFININGKLCELNRIYISISGGTFWFPNVDYIELSGKDPSTQKPVLERFVP